MSYLAKILPNSKIWTEPSTKVRHLSNFGPTLVCKKMGEQNMQHNVHRQTSGSSTIMYTDVCILCHFWDPLFSNTDFPWLFHDQKRKIYDLLAQHTIPSKRYTTYECIPELLNLWKLWQQYHITVH